MMDPWDIKMFSLIQWKTLSFCLFFIFQELHINMENGRNFKFKLCIPERDFTPGKSDIENFTDFLSRSHKVIIIVSNNYLESIWCRFEIGNAQLKMYEENRNLLIFILLDDLKKNDLPRVFRCLMSYSCVLRWPKSFYKQSVFWKRLKLALQE